ncbi:hypothetical protein BVRB_5g116500 [Beta vulgaris subsp. vulgaris]|nr:hypothetical protein BVRB_5g116500 [Beta vulgaris subsp. vulgaris]
MKTETFNLSRNQAIKRPTSSLKIFSNSRNQDTDIQACTISAIQLRSIISELPEQLCIRTTKQQPPILQHRMQGRGAE